MNTKTTTHIIRLSIVASILILIPKVFSSLQNGEALKELPLSLISILIILSPYLFLNHKARKSNPKNSIAYNHLLFTILICLTGTIVLFSLVYISPDPQNGIAIFSLVILQWLACGLMQVIELVLNRQPNEINT